MWISEVSATFFRNFSSFWAGLGSCFRSFMDYSYPRPVCYQPMAIVHCANLVWGILCYRIKMMVHTGFAERVLEQNKKRFQGKQIIRLHAAVNLCLMDFRIKIIKKLRIERNHLKMRSFIYIIIQL